MNKRKQTSICKKGRAGAKRDKCWVYEKGRGKWEAAVQESSIYPAWRQFRSPVFIPLGGRSGTQHLSRLAAVRKPSVYPAWQRFGRPAFIPLGGNSETQHLSRLAATPEPSDHPAWRQFRSPAFIVKHLKNRNDVASPCRTTCTVCGDAPCYAFLSIQLYPAWQRFGSPVFIPLGGNSETQHLSRLAATPEPSDHPAWRQFRSPAFIPLGSGSEAQCLSRLAAIREPSVYPAWRRFGTPAFIPLGGDSGDQRLSRLAAARRVYLPMQKVEKMWPSRSSLLVAPVILPRASWARRRSSASSSPLRAPCSWARASQ